MFILPNLNIHSHPQPIHRSFLKQMLGSSKALHFLLAVPLNWVTCYRILMWFITLLRLLLETQIKRLAWWVKSHTSTLEDPRLSTTTQTSGNNKMISDGRNTKTEWYPSDVLRTLILKMGIYDTRLLYSKLCNHDLLYITLLFTLVFICIKLIYLSILSIKPLIWQKCC